MPAEHWSARHSKPIIFLILTCIGVGIYLGVYYALDASGLRAVVRMVRDILTPGKGDKGSEIRG